MSEIRNKIAELIKQVKPFDQIEEGHIQDILAWIVSGVEIFRLEKPATPLKHLVSYSVLVDLEKKNILLFDHKKALKKLPGGGHLNLNEMPLISAKRELVEELGIEPKLIFQSEAPFFATVMETVGLTPGHVDVDLWYIFAGNSELKINSEAEEFRREFDGYHWLSFDEILALPIEELDFNMHRFINKLKKENLKII